MKLKTPNTLVLLLGMMLVAYLATWLVPQGFFETQTLENGRSVIVPGTFTLAEEQTRLTPMDLLKAIPRAMADAQGIIFFVFIIGGVLTIARATGTVDAFIGNLLERFGHQPRILIFMVIFTFALASSAIGLTVEYIPFVLILVGLCKAMRLDAMTAVGMIVTGFGIGYGVSAFNPFTVVIAQSIADVPIYSGMELRLLIFVPFVLIGFHHVWSYGKKVIANPDASLTAHLPCPLEGKETAGYPTLNHSHRLILLGLVVTIVTAVWGISQHGWYLYELSALFLFWGIFTSIVGRVGPNEATTHFAAGVNEVASTALLVGFARGVALILEDGQIIHSMVYGLAYPLSFVATEIAAIGMLIIQTVLNFFIPSGSGQAYVTIPLLAPVGDIVGVNRQIVVLAFQFGDGFSNMIIPTSAALMGILGVAGIPYNQWFRFCMPLILKLTLAGSTVLAIAIWVDYGERVQPESEFHQSTPYLFQR